MKALRRFLLWAGWLVPRVSDIDGVVRFTPPPSYGQLWGSLQAAFVNDGLPITSTRYVDVTFYAAPLIPLHIATDTTRINYPKGAQVDAFWFKKENTIVFTRTADWALVRHELTHAILQRGDHPTEYFNLKYGTMR